MRIRPRVQAFSARVVGPMHAAVSNLSGFSA
jgi:hypothetical protein